MVDQNGCEEYRELSRRGFIKHAGLSALAISALVARPQAAAAQSAPRDVLISVYLRGAADGLSLCVPHGDPGYYAARPTLAVPAPSSSTSSAIDLDGFFGLPPAMAALLGAYQDGRLLIVHATGSVDGTRSHFDGQHYMEVGKPNDTNVVTGWLGRHLAEITPLNGAATLRGVGIGYGLAETLGGGPKTLPIPDLRTFGYTGNSSSTTRRTAWLTTAYAAPEEVLHDSAINTQATVTNLASINFSGYVPAGGATYATSGFGYALKNVAALIKANVGIEAVHLDVGGWDTHSSQGVLTGSMASTMSALAAGISNFYKDMAASSRLDFTMAVLSEFGRTVRENGSAGTDHGHGNAMFLLGGHIAGGRVLANWPGLAANQLYQNQDLQVTIDHRDILAEVVQNRLGNSDLGAVFPGYQPTFRGVTN